MPCKDLGEMLLVVERQWGCFTGLLGALKVAMVAKVMSGHAHSLKVLVQVGFPPKSRMHESTV